MISGNQFIEFVLSPLEKFLEVCNDQLNRVHLNRNFQMCTFVLDYVV